MLQSAHRFLKVYFVRAFIKLKGVREDGGGGVRENGGREEYMSHRRKGQK